MSRFIAQIDPKKIRNERRYQVFALLGTVILAGGLVYYASDENDRFIPKVVIFLYLVSLLANWLRRKRRELFIEITNDRIAWRLTEPENKTVLSWKEIRWIKRETNDGITIFRDSSFSNHFGLENFSAADQLEIRRLIQEIAAAREIRLVNF